MPRATTPSTAVEAVINRLRSDLILRDFLNVDHDARMQPIKAIDHGPHEIRREGRRHGNAQIAAAQFADVMYRPHARTQIL